MLSGWHPQGAALGELPLSELTEPSEVTGKALPAASIARVHPWVASRSVSVPVTHERDDMRSQ